MVERCGDLYRFEFARAVDDVIDSCGQVPLPPYITRSPDELDEARYQTVFAQHRGSVAAPTAGLHFDQRLARSVHGDGCLDRARNLARRRGNVPTDARSGFGGASYARRANLGECRSGSSSHLMQARGGRVIAIGTTVVRALETAARSGALAAFDGDTDIFIHPGYRFRVVDALVTNFHLPESTLLMLVSAFAGRQFVLDAYADAVRREYRFFSYGDAMFITGRCDDAV